MANFNPDVQLFLEVGFNSSGPSDTSFSWTDVTTDLRNWRIGRGRQFEMDDIQPGTGSFELNNTGRQYDPESTGGAYSPNVDVMKPIRLRAVHSGTTYYRFRGFVTGWEQTWSRGGHDPVCFVEAVDGFKVLAFHETASTSPQEASGTRVGRLLDSAGWSTSLRNLDAGDVTVAAYTPDCAFVLSEISRVVNTEEGWFFMDGQGQATFHDHSHRTGSTSIATFTDTGGGLPYVGQQRRYTDENVWNDITVTAVGATPQATDSTASVDLYGRRKFRRFDTLHTGATAAADTAAEILDRYRLPKTRIPDITVDPVGSTNLWPHSLGRDIGDRITIRQAGKTGVAATYSADFHIEGVNETGTVGNQWETTWLLSPST